MPTRQSTSSVRSTSKYRPGARLGPYTVVQRVADSLYMASRESQAPRLVLLSLFRQDQLEPGWERSMEEARWRLSGKRMDGLSVPLDSGHESGVVYLASEMVAGRPILEVARDAVFSETERIQLILQVCEVVRQAHRRGVFHGSLGLEDILVVEDNGQRTVHVLGFGRPRRRNADGQAPHDVLEADVRALGRLMVELGLGAVGANESLSPASSSLREVEVKASKHSVTDAESDPFLQLRRGEWKAICDRSVNSDSGAGYLSVDAMIRDLRASLESETVDAVSSSFNYRLQKFVQRNRLFASSVILGLVLSIGANVALTRGVIETRARAASEAESGGTWERLGSAVLSSVNELAETLSESGFEIATPLVEFGERSLRETAEIAPSLERATLHRVLYQFLGRIGEPVAALDHAERAHSMLHATLGSDSEATVNALYELTEARELIWMAMRREIEELAEASRRHLGPQDFSTLTLEVCLDRLGGTQKIDDIVEVAVNGAAHALEPFPSAAPSVAKAQESMQAIRSRLFGIR